MHIQTGFVYRVVRPRLHEEGPQRQSFKRKRKVLNVLNVKNNTKVVESASSHLKPLMGNRMNLTSFACSLYIP